MRVRHRVAVRESRAIHRGGRPRALPARRSPRCSAHRVGGRERALRAIGGRSVSRRCRHDGGGGWPLRAPRRSRARTAAFPRSRHGRDEVAQHGTTRRGVLRSEGRAAGADHPAARARPRPSRARRDCAHGARTRWSGDVQSQCATRRRGTPQGDGAVARALRHCDPDAGTAGCRKLGSRACRSAARRPR